MILFYDTETFSETPIANGTHAYAEDPFAEILIESWAVDDGPVQVADKTAGEDGPFDVFDPEDFDAIVMHNGGLFDRIVNSQVRNLEIPVHLIHDTQVQARSHGLPGALDKLCAIFGVPEELMKHSGGKKLIQRFCKPQPKSFKIRRCNASTHPKEWAEFLSYAGGDIHAMRYLYKKMPRWNYPNREHPLWCLDQRINDRGFKVDLDLAHAAIDMVNEIKDETDEQTQLDTDGRVRSSQQRDALLQELLLEHGVRLPDLQATTIERRMEDPDLPDVVKELLGQRLLTSSTSTAKYKAVIRSASSDGRLRGSLLFSGAGRTKRWSGKLFQPQNLPRPDMPVEAVLRAITAIKAGSGAIMLDEPMRAAWNALRGLIVADEGKKLVQADLGQIEARVLPWLAGMQWKLEAFRAFDNGTGSDLYLVGAARILNIPIGEVTKALRQLYGKVPELACILEGTLVLTARGEIPIEQVVSGDLVWDGEHWVSTDGAVFRGERDVIKHDGLWATADHLVWIEGQADPIEFGRAAHHRLRLLRSGQRTRHAANPSCTSSSIDCRQTTLRKSALPRFQKLWSERYSVRFCERVASLCMGARTFGSTPGESRIRSDRQQRFLCARQPTLVHGQSQSVTYSTQQAHSSTASFSRAIPRRKIRRLHAPKPAQRGSDVRGNSRTLASAKLQTKRRVWDLLNCGPLHRFTASGRLVHNCGYGGAAGAFQAMAQGLGMELPPLHEVQEIVRAWREANHEIANWTDGFWVRLENAARQAILNPNMTFEAGEHIRFERWKEWLRMELPSGGFLSYAHPHIGDHPHGGPNSICFFGVNNYTRKWEQLYTYGGRLSADSCQATAREILAHNLQHIEDQGFPIVLTCHDEVITEPPNDPVFSVEKLVAALIRRPPWLDERMPLAADGFEADRYRKED